MILCRRFASNVKDICSGRLGRFGFMQGVHWEYLPLAFFAFLNLIEDMRGEGRRPVKYLGLSSSVLPDNLVRRLVATLLRLPPKPSNRKDREILKMNWVSRNSIAFSCASSKH